MLLLTPAGQILTIFLQPNPPGVRPPSPRGSSFPPLPRGAPAPCPGCRQPPHGAPLAGNRQRVAPRCWHLLPGTQRPRAGAGGVLAPRSPRGWGCSRMEEERVPWRPAAPAGLCTAPSHPSPPPGKHTAPSAREIWPFCTNIYRTCFLPGAAQPRGLGGSPAAGHGKQQEPAPFRTDLRPAAGSQCPCFSLPCFHPRPAKGFVSAAVSGRF